MVWLPPDDSIDGEGWVKALLSDLAGLSENAAELLEGVWDVQSGRATEWSMNYNVYSVEVLPDSVQITFIDDSCRVSLDLLVSVVAKHLELTDDC